MTTPDKRGYAARSDIGLMREGNEDRFLAQPPVFAVADGMGGHQAGEVASGLVIEMLESRAGRPPTPGVDEVVDTLERSNAAILQEAAVRSELAGMGTTCTVVVVDAAIHVAHVGDSRAYLYRDERLVQLTDDHSLVASMVREGLIAPGDAATDGRRNIITRALGAEDQVRVDAVTVDRAAGDRLLVCSDGLHGQVDDAAIAAVLRDEPDPDDAADHLVRLANAAGGDDNVTVIVIDPDALPRSPVAETPAATDGPAAAESGAEDEAAASSPGRRRPRRRVVRFLLIVLVVAMVIVAIVGLLWLRWAASA